MKQSKVLIWITVSFLILLNLWALLQLSQLQTNFNTLRENYRLVFNESENSKRKTESRFVAEKENERLQLNPAIQLIRPAVSDSDTTTLSHLINGQPKLIIRYSNINWSLCSRDFINIGTITEKIGKENIILITAPSRIEDLNAFKTTNKIEIPVYQFLDNRLSIPLERANIPFLFVTDSQFYTQFVFVPEPSMSSMTMAYLEIIKDRFFTEGISQNKLREEMHKSRALVLF
jgi:hypothetical protein